MTYNFGYKEAERAAEPLVDKIEAKGWDINNLKDCVILGSGLGAFPDLEMVSNDMVRERTADLLKSGNPMAESSGRGAAGHKKEVGVGYLQGSSPDHLVLVVDGREHPNDRNVSLQRAAFVVRVFQMIAGREDEAQFPKEQQTALWTSNAAGSLFYENGRLGPGDLMPIFDHYDIKDGYGAVLTEGADPKLGTHFPHSANLYAKDLTDMMIEESQKEGWEEGSMKYGMYIRTGGRPYENYMTWSVARRTVKNAWEDCREYCRYVVANGGTVNDAMLEFMMANEDPVGAIGMSTVYEIDAANEASQAQEYEGSKDEPRENTVVAFSRGRVGISVISNYSRSMSPMGVLTPDGHVHVKRVTGRMTPIASGIVARTMKRVRGIVV